MRRVVIINWKDRAENPFEIFSNLKLLCASYPAYNYNTLNNYLSKSKMPYENEKVRIERKVVHTAAIPQRQMVMVRKKVKIKSNDEEAQNRKYWLSRPVAERLEAATMLSMQLLKKNKRIDKCHVVKRKMW